MKKDRYARHQARTRRPATTHATKRAEKRTRRRNVGNFPSSDFRSWGADCGKEKGCGDSVLIVDSDPKSEVPARILDRLRVTSTHVFLMPGQRFGE